MLKKKQKKSKKTAVKLSKKPSKTAKAEGAVEPSNNTDDVEALAHQYFLTRQERGEYGTQDGDWQAARRELGLE